MSSKTEEQFYYDDEIVKKFISATLLWGAVAFLVGLIIALQIVYWPVNMGLEWITFGRLRPLHTNAAIFAFAGNAIFAGIYHSSQRLLKARMFNDVLSKLHFWGWQLIIVSAALTLPFGITTGKEYAELEWPIDIAITVVWVIFAVNFFGTMVKRREKHLYVAIWFYIATIVTVAVLHIVNSMAIPVAMFKSYPVWAGIQDGLIQWWYGHNAVAFFLTTPFLGLMYYYIPKIVERPVYSYKLSIVHFWALVFLYIWAGPHHLLNTALPDWAQTLGMVFSVMLWAPSWGGMINGLLTLRGVWHLLRTEPTVKFLVAAVTFYGMSTFEGPLLSIKSVNGLAHYTDWIIGHVHSGALGWNGFLAFGMIYYLVPKLWNTKLYSNKLATQHFWLGLTGIIFYYCALVAAGLTQGLMWRAVDAQGALVYPDFVETVNAIRPMYWFRVVGGLFYISGFILMLINIIKTIKAAPKDVKQQPVIVKMTSDNHDKPAEGHRKLEGLGTVFTILALVAILVGSIVEIYPILNIHRYLTSDKPTLPYTPLELAGRDVYIKEGCYVCHSQMIRKMPADVLRYGPESKIEDSMYDHPFQWGSKRTGPDLAREGSYVARPDIWHFRHMMDPRSVTPQSIMPTYPWLANNEIDFGILRKKLSVMKMLDVPYDDATVANADEVAMQQAKTIAEGIAAQGGPAGIEKKEIVALIAYLQALGKKAQ